MMLLHDRATMAHALALDLDQRLHAVLAEHIAALASGEHDLTNWTEFLIVQPGDTEADILHEIGFSPLVEPMDGARFPEPTFFPCWDWLAYRDGWFEMIVTFGSTFASILLIEDDDGMLPALREMCRWYTKS